MVRCPLSAIHSVHPLSVKDQRLVSGWPCPGSCFHSSRWRRSTPGSRSTLPYLSASSCHAALTTKPGTHDGRCVAVRSRSGSLRNITLVFRSTSRICALCATYLPGGPTLFRCFQVGRHPAPPTTQREDEDLGGRRRGAARRPLRLTGCWLSLLGCFGFRESALKFLDHDVSLLLVEGSRCGDCRVEDLIALRGQVGDV